MTSPIADAATQVADAAPLVRRAVGLDPRSVLRIQLSARSMSCFVRLPFGVLVGRTVDAQWDGPEIDCVVDGRELLAWLDGQAGDAPPARDAQWQGTLPPRHGWQRVETVPGGLVRDLVRKGAAALNDAAVREGVAGAQPRAEVADALLDSVVITAHAGPLRAEVPLRALSALTRMGFLARDSRDPRSSGDPRGSRDPRGPGDPRGSGDPARFGYPGEPRGSREAHAAIDVSGRWLRVVAEYGSVYVEQRGSGLTVL